jgi:hypothetical protein
MLMMGNLQYGSQGNLTSIGAVRVVISDYNQEHPLWAAYVQQFGVSTPDERLEVHMLWESAIVDLLLPMHRRSDSSPFSSDDKYGSLNLDFLVERSSNDVVAAGGDFQKELLVVSYCISFLYLYWSLGRFSLPMNVNHFIYSRTLLAMAALLSIGMATACAFGAVAYNQSMGFSPVVINLIPYIALGLGLQNYFVVAQTLIDHCHLQVCCRCVCISSASIRTHRWYRMM